MAMSLRSDSGFTLIEVVIGVAIMAIMVAAISQLFLVNLASVTLGKARASGLGLANSQIEYIRSLPYLSVATQNGAIYPAGNIPDSQTVVQDGQTFTLKTDIRYIDDIYDGKAPTDTNPADYKRATVSVYLKTNNKLVSRLTTDIANKNESSMPNTGVLSLTVIGASGQAIPNANVTVTNATVTPAVNISTVADNYGILSIPNLPIDSTNDYQVIASLPGYSTSGTIPAPVSPQTAVILNPNILNQQVTSLTLAIDQVSTMIIKVKDTTGAAIANSAITVTGAKKLKQTPDVYKYSAVSTSDATGSITLSNMEWDSYSFTPPAGYYVVAASPYAPFALSPGTSQTVTLTLSNNSAWPRIATMAPITASAIAGTMLATITGANLPTGTVVKLKKAGSPDVTATAVVSLLSNTKLTMSFLLTGVTPGVWDIAVTNGANTTTQTGGLVVTP